MYFLDPEARLFREHTEALVWMQCGCTREPDHQNQFVIKSGPVGVAGLAVVIHGAWLPGCLVVF